MYVKSFQQKVEIVCNRFQDMKMEPYLSRLHNCYEKIARDFVS